MKVFDRTDDNPQVVVNEVGYIALVVFSVQVRSRGILMEPAKKYER